MSEYSLIAKRKAVGNGYYYDFSVVTGVYMDAVLSGTSEQVSKVNAFLEEVSDYVYSIFVGEEPRHSEQWLIDWMYEFDVRTVRSIQSYIPENEFTAELLLTVAVYTRVNE